MTTSFGKFRLLQQIGGGQLSQVFRVSSSWNHTPTDIALKRVSPSLIVHRNYIQIVVREAGLLSRLTHPNLCQCQEMGVIDGCAFFTLELVNGCTLRALIKRMSEEKKALPTVAIAAIAKQLSEVLHYLHHHPTHPLIHLDLSPQNVMISVDGQIKLIDFGIARFLDGNDPPPLEGKLAGTIGYMSPEQASGSSSLDTRSDQFGLGVLLWEMLSMKRLFQGNTKKNWQRMRHGELIEPNALMNRRPKEFVDLVLQLLAPHPDERFADIADMQRALKPRVSTPHEGVTFLGSLVTRFMAEPTFDPFNVIAPPTELPLGPVIPTGEASLEDYEEISITVDHGEGSPAELLRSVIPYSPFLES